MSKSSGNFGWRSTPRGAAVVAWSLALAVVLHSCSTNPATGKKQLNLVSEDQEIAMGKEADQQIPGQLGLYEDRELQDYVSDLGLRLAAESERPHLPWTFRVVDDDVVNAFALPGGYIYVTRGILGHMSDEAELAGVLGHEIGHVTARHGVNQMSKGMLAQIGLGLGSVLSPEIANLAGLAQTGLSLLFLKYGRDDERQADDLAFRYGARADYDPRSLIDLFALLERVGHRAEASGQAGGLPTWMASHPAPEARRAEAEKVVQSLDIDLDRLRVNRDQYMRRIDGIVFGADPRQGYFRNQRFYHPDMRFELAFPNDWKTANLRQAVMAQQPDGEAVITLTLSGAKDAETGARALADQGANPVREWRNRIGGNPAVSYYWTADLQGTPAAGLAAFVEHEGRVYRLLGYTTQAAFDRYRDDLESTLSSFNQLEDRRALAVQPMRVRVERLDRAMTIDRLAKTYDVPLAVEDLALLNNVDARAELRAGDWVKIVEGEPPP